MFLHLLNDTQQKAFLALAKQFVEADHKLSSEEQNLVELMYAETGLPFETELPTGDREALIAPFDNRQVQSAVLLELIGVGRADEEFSAEENAFVRETAAKFGFSTAELEKMQLWVEKQIALVQEAESFWS
jgi:tellurite resistance protein